MSSATVTRIERPLPPMKSHTWAPIDDLPENWEELVDAQVPALVQTWLEQAEELRSRESFHRFQQRLRRQFAIETGALEDVYRISEGATRTLIEKGLDAALISHEDTDQPPEMVVEKILDQHRAIDGLYQFVSSQRSLTKPYIRELHQVLTQHQDTYPARDSLGRFVQAPLPHGEWKKQPNNVEGPNGFCFEFCPPVQVESEMDRLLELYNRHTANGVSPLVEAAWLHHRFALIHPFADGNGRVPRCLSTLVLLKARWLPLIVIRADKPAYIAALRRADDGDLQPLVMLFGNLQRRCIRDALKIREETLREASKIRGIVQTIKTGLAKRREEKNELVDRSLRLAAALQGVVESRLKEVAQDIAEAITSVDPDYRAFAFGAGPGDTRAGYYYYQIVQCARQLGYYANMSGFRAWAALAMVTEMRTETLFAFHEMGHGSSGVVCCSAMIYSKRPGDEDDRTIIGEVTPLSSEPFEFTYAEDESNVHKRFEKWLDECLVEGLTQWKNEII